MNISEIQIEEIEYDSMFNQDIILDCGYYFSPYIPIVITSINTSEEFINWKKEGF